MDNQHHVNRRRRNLPAELKVEIVDCFPVENAVHFLANVPNRLIIHHCAPRVRRMLKMIPQIIADYARTLPAPNYYGQISRNTMDKYTPEMDIFLRYGATHCRGIWGYPTRDFVGYPADFFDNLIKHYYETKVPGKALHHMTIKLPLNNPAPWPTALLQPQAGEMKLEEDYNDGKLVKYILHNKHKPDIQFNLVILFEEGKCYQQMTYFFIRYPIIFATHSYD